MIEQGRNLKAYLQQQSKALCGIGQVMRLETDYQTVSLRPDSARANDIIITSHSGKPLLVASPKIAAHLKNRPLVLNCAANPSGLELVERRRFQRTNIC